MLILKIMSEALVLKRGFLAIILVILMFSLFEFSACAANAQTDVHYIRTGEELMIIDSYPNDTYYLMNNIVVTGSVDTMCGDSDTPFTGVLDGKGFTITYFNVESGQETVAIFGYSSGTIKSVKFSNCRIESSNPTAIVGGIVAYNSGTIADCSFSGIIMLGNEEVKGKGIAAINYGSISGCSDNTLTYKNPSLPPNSSDNVYSEITVSETNSLESNSAANNSSFEYNADNTNSVNENGSKQSSTQMETSSERQNAEKFFNEKKYEQEPKMSKATVVILTTIVCVGLSSLGAISIYQEIKITRRKKKDKKSD